MIRIERAGVIATVTIDRPEAMNALSPQMFRDLTAFWTEFDRDDSLHVAIVTGAGRAFCAGRDLVRPTAMADERERARQRAAAEAADPGPAGVWKPVIAAINGWCLASGFALALSCDLRLIAEGARIGSIAPKRGLLPGAGQVQRLARYIPFGSALELLLRSHHIDALPGLSHRPRQRRPPAPPTSAHRPRLGRRDRRQRPPRRARRQARRL